MALPVDSVPRLVAAVDVGGTSIKGALADVAGALQAKRRLPIRGLPPQQVVDATVKVVRELVGEAARRGTPVGAVGLAVPGIVDEEAGVGNYSLIIGWRDVPFVDIMRREFGVPVAFSHDVSAGAFAEVRRGAAKGHHDWLFLALGTGVGSTFVLGGRPYRGYGGTGGELAHVICQPDGPLCRCVKRGCLEMIASASAVAEQYALASGVALAEGAAVSGAHVAALVRAGDPHAVRVWQRAVAALAGTLAFYVESMDPSCIVIGGGLAESGPLLLQPLRRELERLVSFASTPPDVRPAAFGDTAALQGVGICAHDLWRDGDRATAFPFQRPGGDSLTVLPRPR